MRWPVYRRPFQNRLFVSTALLTVFLFFAGLALNAFPIASAAADSQFFPQTGHTVTGKFLTYWQSNGGLAAYGYPLTDAQNEVDPQTGQTFLTQWFERNRFELHPEFAGTRYEVLLGLLGKDLRREALKVDADFQRVPKTTDPALPDNEQIYFDPTGHNLRGLFYDYWRNKGGLDRFGYPLTETHREIDPETGNLFDVQWFERARFELHPENQPPYNVLLGLLGKQLKTPKPGLEFAWKIPVGSGHETGPSGLALDPQSNFFVAETGDNQIEKFTNGGVFVSKFGGYGNLNGQLNHPLGLAVDHQGNVYVADRDNFRVQKFNNNGGFATAWGSQGNGDSQFDGVAGIAIDSQNNVFVTDTNNNRVQKFSSSGNFLGKWDAGGMFEGPAGITIDAQNNVYVSDAANRITKLSSTGQVLGRWGSQGRADGQLNGAAGLAVDSQGNLYVADSGNQRLQKFSNVGGFLGKYGSKGDEDGRVQNPVGLAIDANGNLFLADTGNRRIEKFRLR